MSIKEEKNSSGIKIFFKNNVFEVKWTIHHTQRKKGKKNTINRNVKKNL